MNVIQLTRPGTAPFGELADPSAPWLTAEGKVRIYGTGTHFLEFDSWSTFFAGGERRCEPIRLLDAQGRPIRGGNRAWDVSLHHWRETGETLLYAGVMSPTGGRGYARWPHDNWTRRVYAFRETPYGWRQEKLPLFGGAPPSGKPAHWVGHFYGHHFIEDEVGTTWVFYERVDEERRNSRRQAIPFRTEIFARPMNSPTRASEEEVRILGIPSPAYPATSRKAPVTHEPNGYLVEGPRPVRVVIEGKPFYLIGFSSGDFPTDRYGINVAWSRNLLGPYLPLLQSSSQGLDLRDLGSEIRERYQLSWGPARPSFFVDERGHWWALFHAVEKADRPHVDYAYWPNEPLHHFHRNIYLAPLLLRLGADGAPEISLGSKTPETRASAGEWALPHEQNPNANPEPAAASSGTSSSSAAVRRA